MLQHLSNTLYRSGRFAICRNVPSSEKFLGGTRSARRAGYMTCSTLHLQLVVTDASPTRPPGNSFTELLDSESALLSEEETFTPSVRVEENTYCESYIRKNQEMKKSQKIVIHAGSFPIHVYILRLATDKGGAKHFKVGDQCIGK